MDDICANLARIAAALERLAPQAQAPTFGPGWAFVWRGRSDLAPAFVEGPPLDLILEVDAQKAALLANARRFAQGHPANNVLLWGARGTGKSALLKAVARTIAQETSTFKLIEIAPEALPDLPALLAALGVAPIRAMLFIDDLSFAGPEPALKALKPALDGGLAGRPANVLVAATSNRRQIVAQTASAGEAHDVFAADAAEEILALADRFGLSLGFHALDQDGYLRIVQAYAQRFGLPVDAHALAAEALTWSRRRAARSGRTAWQFILDLAGRLDRPVAF